MAEERSPSFWLKICAIFLFFVIAPLVLWLVFDYGRYRGGYDRFEAATRESELEHVIATGEDLRLALEREKLAMIRASEIDQQAYTHVEQSLKDLQDEVLELQEEVAFYRAIVAPNETESGIQIQNLALTQNGETRTYAYKLVLTQVIEKNRYLRGNVTFVVHGIVGDAPKELKLKDVAVTGDASLKVRFKYFQTLQGDINLPEDFVPARVSVELKIRGKKPVKLKKSFDWPDIVA